MKSIIEERCKAGFDDFLRRRLGSVDLGWRDGDEPPDYYLALDGTEFAIEVTSLMSGYQAGNSRLTTKGINSSLTGLVQQVEQLAVDRKVLRGTYAVSFLSPFDRFKAIQSELSERLLDYLELTHDLDNSPRQTVFGQGRHACRVEKLHVQKDQVFAVPPVVMRWEGEAASEICSLLRERMVTKSRKLRHVTQPKILLLYDAYLFAGPDMIMDCMKQLSDGAMEFHTIFVVQDQEGLVLWSENADWYDD